MVSFLGASCLCSCLLLAAPDWLHSWRVSLGLFIQAAALAALPLLPALLPLLPGDISLSSGFVSCVCLLAVGASLLGCSQLFSAYLPSKSSRRHMPLIHSSLRAEADMHTLTAPNPQAAYKGLCRCG
jgi:hypothetical protein